MPSRKLSELLRHYKLDTEFLPDRSIRHTTFPDAESRHHRRRPRKTVQEWTFERDLGSGGSSKTVRVEKIRTPTDRSQVRAVKVIEKQRVAIDYDRALEALIVSSLRKYHSLFVPIYGWFEDAQHLYIPTEYLSHGNLSHHLQRPFPVAEAARVVRQLLEGLEVIHANGFAHRNVKPQNIFVYTRWPRVWVKLGDFDITTGDESWDHAELESSAAPCYYPPEVVVDQELLEEDPDYTTAGDMWSLGCVVYEVLTSATLFPNYRALEQYCNNRNSHQALSSNGIDIKAMCFMRRLLVSQPEQRPSASSAMQDEWIVAVEEEVEDYSDGQDSLLGDIFADTPQTLVASPDATFVDIDSMIATLPTLIPSLDSSLLLQLHQSQPNTVRILYVQATSQGVCHPETLKTLIDAGKAYVSLGKSQPASKFFEAAQILTKQALGADNPQTLHLLSLTGETLYNLKDYENALVYLKPALEGQPEVLGAEHPETLKTLSLTGACLYELGTDVERALEMLNTALDGQGKVLGQEHPDTLMTITALGRGLFMMNY